MPRPHHGMYENIFICSVAPYTVRVFFSFFLFYQNAVGSAVPPRTFRESSSRPRGTVAGRGRLGRAARPDVCASCAAARRAPPRPAIVFAYRSAAVRRQCRTPRNGSTTLRRVHRPRRRVRSPLGSWYSRARLSTPIVFLRGSVRPDAFFLRLWPDRVAIIVGYNYYWFSYRPAGRGVLLR